MLERTKQLNGITVVRHYDEFNPLEKFIVWLHRVALRRCTICHWRGATWSYMPGWEDACDLCVPRGCSCNQDDNGKEPLDPQGRPFPCVEWMEI